MSFLPPKKAIPVIALAFINFLNFSILIPVLPFVAQEFELNDIAYGVLLALYPIAQILCVQFFAQLSNKFGRKPVILLTQLGTTLSWLLFCVAYFVPNIAILTVPLPIIVIGIARIADGITGANMLVANAYVADIATVKNRVRIFGQVEAAVAIGSLVGPLAGSILAGTQWNFLAPGVFAFVVSLVGLVVITQTLQESIAKKQPDLRINYMQSINILHKVLALGSHKMLMSIFAQRFVFQMLFNGFLAVILPYLIFMFDIQRGGYEMTVILIIFGLFLLINQLVIVPILVGKFGSRTVFVMGEVMMILSLLVFGFTSLVSVLWVAFWVLMLGVSISLTLFKPFITTNVPSRQQAEALAVEEQIMTLTAAISPVLSMAVYAQLLQQTFVAFAGFGLIGVLIIIATFKIVAPQEGKYQESTE